MSLMSSHGYAVEAFASAEAFLGSDRRRTTDCLIVDFQMPGMTGVELHERLAASEAPVPTIMISARQDAGTRRRALESGVVCYLTKPFDEAHLMGCLRSALAGARHGDGA